MTGSSSGFIDRKTEIIQAVVDIIHNKGISETTTARIADEVGISEQVLYSHFQSKDKMLLAALEESSNKLIEITMSAAAGEEGMLERLRLMSAAFYDFVMEHPGEARVLFELGGRTRDEALRIVVRGFVCDLVAVVEAVIIGGILEGVLKPDIDVSGVAWEIMSLGLTMYVISVLDLEHMVPKSQSMSSLERLLGTIIVT